MLRTASVFTTIITLLVLANTAMSQANHSLRDTLPNVQIKAAEWIKGDPIVIEVVPGGETINEALKRATPGTIINVRAGDYPGALDLSGLHGTSERPILLVSADGPGKARLIGNPQANQATVGAWGISYVGIYGFEISCDTAPGDNGGVKIGGPWAAPAEHVTLAGSLITGSGQDGVKFLHGARNILVAGNIVQGQWRQECFDNVSVEKMTFAYNTTTPECRPEYTSLTIKSSSRDCEIFGNDFKATTWMQLLIGGYGGPHGPGHPEYWNTGYQASRFNVHGNDFGGPQSVHFAGGRDSVLRGNRLRGTVGQGLGGETPPRKEPSEGNTIEDNDRDVGPVGASALPQDMVDLRPGGVLWKASK